MSRALQWVRNAEDRQAIEMLRDTVGGRRTVLVHDYLVQDGGAERVLGVLADALGDCRLQVLCADHGVWGKSFHGVPIETTWAQHLLRTPSHFRRLLPAFPFAVRSMYYPKAELLLSSSSAFAKAARAPDGAHLCYCYNPMRFAYDTDTYLHGSIGARVKSALLAPLMATMRRWDHGTSQADRIDAVVGISTVVQGRIRARWGRDAALLFPPVDVQRTTPRRTWSPDGPFVVLARLLAYKRIDLAVAACSRLGVRLDVIGDGPDRARLEGLAGPSVRFLGRLDDAGVNASLAGAAALLWPGEEDFGIAPVEAMAAGTPVIALAAGGALDTVAHGQTGLHVPEPTVDAMVAAIQQLRESHFAPEALVHHASSFSTASFVRGMASLVSELLSRAR